MDEDDIFGKGSGEARDDISSLPKHVAVKVSNPNWMYQVKGKGDKIVSLIIYL